MTYGSDVEVVVSLETIKNLREISAQLWYSLKEFQTSTVNCKKMLQQFEYWMAKADEDYVSFRETQLKMARESRIQRASKKRRGLKKMSKKEIKKFVLDAYRNSREWVPVTNFIEHHALPITRITVAKWLSDAQIYKPRVPNTKLIDGAFQTVPETEGEST